MDYFTIPVQLAKYSQSKEERLDSIKFRDRETQSYIAKMLEKHINGKLSRTELNKLFLTSKSRPSVKYDLKKQFVGYTREFQEMIENTMEAIHSYLAIGGNYPYSKKKKPETTRRMRYRRLVNGERTAGTAMIIEDPSNSVSTHWLSISDPYQKGNLKLPLKSGKKLAKFLSDYGISFNDVRSVTVSGTVAHLTFEDKRSSKTNLAIDPRVRIKTGVGDLSDFIIPSPNHLKKKERVAILTIDQGIRVRLTGAWMLPGQYFKQEFARFYSVPEHNRLLHIRDKEISKRQHCLNTLKKEKQLHPQIKKIRNGLKRSRDKWKSTYEESETLLIQALLVEVLQWQAMGWEVHVVIGYPKHIKDIVPKIASRHNRRRNSRWRYFDFIEKAKRKFKPHNPRVIEQSEEFTSKTCSHCGYTEYRKYRTQTLQRKYSGTFRHGGWFECLKCHFKLNADVNGAINIGRAYLITTLFPLDERELLKYQRRQEWWTYEKRYIRKLKKKKKNGKPLFKKGSERWDYLKKLPAWRMSPLRWMNYPTHHIPKLWRIWSKRTDAPRSVPDDGDLHNDMIIIHLLDPSAYFSSPVDGVTNLLIEKRVLY